MIKTVISNFHMYIYLALITAIFYLGIQNHYLKKDNELLNFQVELHVEQLFLLEKSSKIHEEKVILASSIASTNIEKRSVEANKILREEVSKDCDKAIEWGISQAQKL